MNKEDNFGRLLVLLLIVLAICSGLYYLPDTLFGYKIKKVDLLSDIRIKPQSSSIDSLRMQLEQSDSLRIDSVAIQNASGTDSVILVLRDSLYKAVYAAQGADSLGVQIEDYSVGHTGLKRFFAMLNNNAEMARPVRIAVLGDSFIEGDIMVADFRNEMQKRYGGRGVGFVPVTSKTAQFRPTVEQNASGWTAKSMLTNKEHIYTLSGIVFEPEGEKSTISVKTANRYPNLQSVSSLKLLYERSKATRMHLVCNGKDTISETLSPTSIVTQYERSGTFTEANFTFTNTEDFRPLGIALEDNSGVVVDNYSLRGNSGLILDRLDIARCQALNEIRTYDLIILQYGLNVVSEDMLQYGWYTQGMVKVIRHLKICFPDADILLLGVSDRSHQEDGEFETMPGVLALLHAQRTAARNAEVPFWNVFGAMGGENSMVRFVNNNWASKDYTHLSFRGGREIASALLKAILLEKKFYDEAEKAAY